MFPYAGPSLNGNGGWTDGDIYPGADYAVSPGACTNAGVGDVTTPNNKNPTALVGLDIDADWTCRVDGFAEARNDDQSADYVLIGDPSLRMTYWGIAPGPDGTHAKFLVRTPDGGLVEATVPFTYATPHEFTFKKRGNVMSLYVDEDEIITNDNGAPLALTNEAVQFSLQPGDPPAAQPWLTRTCIEVWGPDFID